MFYNTTAAGIIVLLNRNKSIERKGQILLVNASAYFVKERPKNSLTDEGIAAVAEVYYKWETREKISKVITLDDARAADYNLSPSLFVSINDILTHRSLSEILPDLAAAGAEREKADEKLIEILTRLGLKKATTKPD